MEVANLSLSDLIRELDQRANALERLLQENRSMEGQITRDIESLWLTEVYCRKNAEQYAPSELTG